MDKNGNVKNHYGLSRVEYFFAIHSLVCESDCVFHADGGRENTTDVVFGHSAPATPPQAHERAQFWEQLSCLHAILFMESH